MFVLLKWVKSNQVTIMAETPDLKKFNEGDIVKVNYEGKPFEGILIKRSSK